MILINDTLALFDFTKEAEAPKRNPIAGMAYIEITPDDSFQTSINQ